MVLIFVCRIYLWWQEDLSEFIIPSFPFLSGPKNMQQAFVDSVWRKDILIIHCCGPHFVPGIYLWRLNILNKHLYKQFLSKQTLDQWNSLDFSSCSVFNFKICQPFNSSILDRNRWKHLWKVGNPPGKDLSKYLYWNGTNIRSY